MSSPPLAITPEHYGITVPAEFVRARDVDTLEWRLAGSAFVWASRLIDAWGPELHSRDDEKRAIALRGREFVEASCSAADEFVVHIPLPTHENILKSLTFDRIPSWIYLDGSLLNSTVVRRGFASSTKCGELGN